MPCKYRADGSSRYLVPVSTQQVPFGIWYLLKPSKSVVPASGTSKCGVLLRRGGHDGMVGAYVSLKYTGVNSFSLQSTCESVSHAGDGSLNSEFYVFEDVAHLCTLRRRCAAPVTSPGFATRGSTYTRPTFVRGTVLVFIIWSVRSYPYLGPEWCSSSNAVQNARGPNTNNAIYIV